MKHALWLILVAVLGLAGCAREPVPEQRLTGSPLAVAGFPRFNAPGRFSIENCCTLRLGPDARAVLGQGIDSVIYAVTGAGYTLDIMFGPYDSGQPMSGYRRVGRRTIDGVELVSFEWRNPAGKPPEGQYLWLARVGGGKIGGGNHTPWGLRIQSSCGTVAGCQAASDLVASIRF